MTQDAEQVERDRLLSQARLADGFWLAFAFIPHPAQMERLRAALAAHLDGQGGLKVLTPETPEQLRSLVVELVTKDFPGIGGLWIEVGHADNLLEPVGPWAQALDHVVLRLNERRDLLARKFPHGLVIAAPPWAKVRVRDAAPDLWSIRALVVEMPAVCAPSAPLPANLLRNRRFASGMSQDRLEEVVRQAKQQSPGSTAALVNRAVVHIRAAQRLFDQGKGKRGLKESAAALGLLEPLSSSAPLLWVQALLQAAAGHMQCGQTQQARARLEQCFLSAHLVPARYLAEPLVTLVGLMVEAGDPQLLAGLVDPIISSLEAEPATPSRDGLVRTLHTLAALERMRGDPQAALSDIRRALVAARQRVPPSGHLEMVCWEMAMTTQMIVGDAYGAMASAGEVMRAAKTVLSGGTQNDPRIWLGVDVFTGQGFLNLYLERPLTAEQAFLEALGGMGSLQDKALEGEDVYQFVAATKGLAEAYRMSGREAEAVKLDAALRVKLAGGEIE